MDGNSVAEKFDAAAERYDSNRKAFIACFDELYSAGISILGSIGIEPGRILDLGAGTGLLTERLRDAFPRAEYDLVDISERMLEIARGRFSGVGKINYVIGDYSKNMPRSEYDVIASALSIHHLDEGGKRYVYAEALSRLRDGGALVNIDQFDAESAQLNDAMNEAWIQGIEAGGIGESEMEAWRQRRKLDKENSIRATIVMLREVGFESAECVYRNMKFGAVAALK